MVSSKYDIPLKLLFDRKIITSRALTVCKEICRSPTLHDAIDFYKEHGKFIKVRYCGITTNDELIKICKRPYVILERLNKKELVEI